MGNSPLCTNHKNEQEFEKLFDAMSCEKKITVKVILRQSSWFTDHKGAILSIVRLIKNLPWFKKLDCKASLKVIKSLLV